MLNVATVVSLALTEEVGTNGLRFTCREDPNGIYLATRTTNGGTLQHWELCEQERPIHSLFSSGSATVHCLQWQCMSVFNCANQIASVCSPRHIWASGHESASVLHHLVVGTRNGDLICVQKDNMQQVHSFL